MLEGGIVALIAAHVAAAVLVVAGVHPPTQVALSAGAFLVVAVFLLVFRRRRPVRVGGLAWLAAAGLGLTLLQLVPLPVGLLRVISPAAAELREELGGSWAPITLDVPATLLAAARLATGLGLTVVVACLARSQRRARQLLWALSVLGALIAVVSFVQRALGVQAILGVYLPRNQPGSGIFGTFVNGNHAASLFALSTLVAAGLALQARQRERAIAGSIALVCGVATLSTGSRAGAAGLLAGCVVLLGVTVSRSLGRARGWSVAVAVSLALGAVGLAASPALRSRLDLERGDLFVNQKTRGWAAALDTLRDYPLAGVGRGAVEGPLAMHRATTEGVRLIYPESLPLQVAIEWGLPGCALLGYLLVRWLSRVGRPGHRLELATVGAAAGTVAVLLHELADFGLEIPGVAVPFTVAIAVVAGRLDELSTNRGRSIRLPVRAAGLALAGWGALLGGATWAVPRTVEADSARADALVRARAPEAVGFLREATARHPADAVLELSTATDLLRQGDLKALHHINRALRLFPADWRGHHYAARALVAAGRLPQAALEYRLAIDAGMPLKHAELIAALGAHAAAAVPQRAALLVALARTLIQAKRIDAVVPACERALAAEDATDQTRVACVELALAAHADPATLARLTESALGALSSADTLVVVARAIARARGAAEADQLLQRALARRPSEGDLLLGAARFKAEGGDLEGAERLLTGARRGGYSLAHRQALEELLAMIAERRGDSAAAVMARARARQLARSRAFGEDPIVR